MICPNCRTALPPQATDCPLCGQKCMVPPNFPATAHRWTARAILRAKTLPFLILTILLTLLCNQLADQLFTYVMNIGNTHTYITNYTLGPLGLLFLLPSALLSILLLKIYLHIRGTAAPEFPLDSHAAMRAQAQLAQDQQFHWSNLYGLAVGYLLLTLWIFGTRLLPREMFSQAIPIWMLLSLLWTVAVFFAVKYLNKAMRAKTKTNAAVLAAVACGAYQEIIPADIDVADVCTLLEKGRVTSVQNAIRYLRLRRFLLQIGAIGVLIAIVITLLTLGILNGVASAAGSSLAAQTSAEDFQLRQMRRAASNAQDAANRAQQKANDAVFHARQAEKQAKNMAYRARFR